MGTRNQDNSESVLENAIAFFFIWASVFVVIGGLFWIATDPNPRGPEHKVSQQRQYVTFVIYPSAHPEEDLFGCQNGWVEDAYSTLENGGALVTCAQLFHGETTAGYYARRNAG